MKITIERKEAYRTCTKGAVFLNSMYKLCDSREPILENAIPPGHYFLELQPRHDGKLVPFILLCNKFPVATFTDKTREHPMPGTIQLELAGRVKEGGTVHLDTIVKAMLEAERFGEPVVLCIR